jgi:hypothetical protein
VNIWNGLGTALEDNVVGCIVQQVKATADSLNQARQNANQESDEVAGIRAQVVVVSKKQRDEEFKVY